MPKHRSRSKDTKKAKRKNYNLRLSSACQSQIRSFVSKLQGESPALSYLQSEYLSKFTGKDTGISAEQRKSAAIAKWKNIDAGNKVTNDRLRGLSRSYNILPRVTFDRFLQVAQHQVKNILGDLSDELAFGSFSGGASTSRRRTHSHPALKYSEKADITKDTVRYVPAITGHPGVYREYRFLSDLTVVPGAILFTVPKNTDIDRCACKEPDVNMYLQKAVGGHIRSRLRRFGVNLNDQSINRRLAHLGSVDGSLATLDLSSASDSISIKAVQALLPSDWFEYLDDIRSKHVEVNDTLVRTEMFSSMGNGFTFELESLLFYSLMKATAYLRGHSGTISVYGDDIIIPSGMHDDATWILQEFGFSCNMKKSFHEGPFRESCGGHYLLGHDVTPFYLRKEPKLLTDLIRICNQFRKWLSVCDGRQYEHPNAYQLWRSLAEFVPEEFWGGVDCDVDTQLVSDSIPVSKLVRDTHKVRISATGAYLQWLTLTRNRTRGPSAMEATTSTTMHDDLDAYYRAINESMSCRKRRAKPSAFVSRPWLFIEELVPSHMS